MSNSTYENDGIATPAGEGGVVTTAHVGIPVNQEHQLNRLPLLVNDNKSFSGGDKALRYWSIVYSLALLLSNCVYTGYLSYLCYYYWVPLLLYESLPGFIFSVLLILVPKLPFKAIIFAPVIYAIFTAVNIWLAILDGEFEMNMWVYIIIFISGPQLIYFSIMANAVRQREAGKWTSVLPHNANKEGQVSWFSF